MPVIDQFTKMRSGRHRAAAIKWPATQPVTADVPAVPFMEIEGVRYVESSCLEGGEFWHDCDGCAFADKTDEQCEHASVIGRITFGESCGPRRAIYIKAI